MLTKDRQRARRVFSPRQVSPFVSKISRSRIHESVNNMECALLCSPQHTFLGKEGCLREAGLLLDVLYRPDPHPITSKPTRASRSENAYVGRSTTVVFLSVRDKCSTQQDSRENCDQISTHLPNPFTLDASASNCFCIK